MRILVGGNIVILDDVISTGSTLQGMRMLMERAGAKVCQGSCHSHRGRTLLGEEIVSTGHLPSVYRLGFLPLGPLGRRRLRPCALVCLSAFASGRVIILMATLFIAALTVLGFQQD
jgi:hypothetical protein